MKTKKQKGFTLVELVIVIAVIAILAAVLIPTFSSLVKKANESADIQAARQMNTHLALEAATEDMTITNVYEALLEGGMTAKDYHPLIKDRFYFWDSKLNRVIYTDEKYNVLYPEDYKDQTSQDNWYSLSGVINEDKNVKADENGKVEISTAEQLYYLSNNFETVVNKATDNKVEITLTKDINVMGADIAFKFNEAGTYTISANSEVKITGLAQLTFKRTQESTGSSSGKNYSSGLIAEIIPNKVNDKYENVTVNVKNIIIENAVIGDLETGSVGALIGSIRYTSTVNIESCKVLNSTINGKNKVGALIGQIGEANVTIDGCKVDECTVNSSEGEAGKAIGCIYSSDSGTVNVDIKQEFNKWVTNTTLNLVDGEHTRTKVENVTVNCGTNKITGVTLVHELSSEGTEQTEKSFDSDVEYRCMRMFKSTSYASVNVKFQNTIKINEASQNIFTHATTTKIQTSDGKGKEVTNISYDESKTCLGNNLYFFE